MTLITQPKLTTNLLFILALIKDENIGFDGYIGTLILRIYPIYRRYIDRYFYMNIDISEIKLLSSIHNRWIKSGFQI